MVTISKRLRGVLTPNPEPESNSRELEEFRRKVRTALNKPFQFEPKPLISTWEAASDDPLAGFFKPFSKVQSISLLPTEAEIRREVGEFNWRKVLLLSVVGALLVAAWFVWQTASTLNRFPGVVSPIPTSVLHQIGVAPMATPAATTVPSDTPLNVGGSSTQRQPTASSLNSGTAATTNLSAPANSGAPSGSIGGNSGGGATAPTCPSGKVCSGRAIDGSDCTASNPCSVIYSAGLVSTGATLISGGVNALGQPCTATNPCVLTH